MLKPLPLCLALLALSACSTNLPSAPAECVDSNANCATPDRIRILGTPDETASLRNVAQAAADTFADTFGRRPANTVIAPGGIISAEQRARFKADGYPVLLPWLSADDKARLREQSIREQVLAQTRNLPEPMRQAALEQALAAAPSAQEKTTDEQAGALAHELGHLWFMHAFRPATSTPESGHGYGGWAPDWLDETAAILLENDTLIDSRRRHFASLTFSETIPLNEFLSMAHPSAKAAQQLQQAMKEKRGGASSGDTGTYVLTGKEAEAFLEQSGGAVASIFYAQAQVFSDFVLSQTGDIGVYVALTEHLAAGGRIETWLAEQGATWNLPNDIWELTIAWQNWVSERYGNRGDADTTPD